MQLKLVYVVSILLIGYFTHKNQYFRYSKPLIKRNYDKTWSEQSKSFYDATQIGYKRKVPKQLIKDLKQLGIIHLLTPSGIHLASVLTFARLLIPNKALKFLILIFTLLVGLNGNFHSIRRVLYFYNINSLVKNTKVSFFLTFLLDLCIGGLIKSPLSFSLSFLFWGVIIFSPRNKVSLLINLFIAQLICCYFFQGSINFMAIILNPLVTSLFSLLFPFLTLAYWIQLFDSINIYIINFFVFIIPKLNITFFLFKPSFSVFLLPLIKGRLLIFALVFHINDLGPLEKKKKLRGHLYLKNRKCKIKVLRSRQYQFCYKRNIKKRTQSKKPTKCGLLTLLFF